MKTLKGPISFILRKKFLREATEIFEGFWTEEAGTNISSAFWIKDTRFELVSKKNGRRERRRPGCRYRGGWTAGHREGEQSNPSSRDREPFPDPSVAERETRSNGVSRVRGEPPLSSSAPVARRRREVSGVRERERMWQFTCSDVSSFVYCTSIHAFPCINQTAQKFSRKNIQNNNMHLFSWNW